MKAMIFAAGLGTRLFPLTKDKPKALAPFADTTLLAYNLKYLASQGIGSFIINTHHFANTIEEYLMENNNFGLDIKISYEKELLDTAGGLAKVRDLLLNDKQILLYNVDVISNLNIKKMLANHLKIKSDITLAMRQRETSRYLLFDRNGKMTGWKNERTGEIITCACNSEKVNKYAFSGISLINVNILDKIGSAEKKSLITYFLNICKYNIISANLHNDDYWFDCGSIEKLQIAEKFISEIK
jgi:NDP-sugar pyrophosphorylase family protein